MEWKKGLWIVKFRACSHCVTGMIIAGVDLSGEGGWVGFGSLVFLRRRRLKALLARSNRTDFALRGLLGLGGGVFGSGEVLAGSLSCCCRGSYGYGGLQWVVSWPLRRASTCLDASALRTYLSIFLYRLIFSTKSSSSHPQSPRRFRLSHPYPASATSLHPNSHPRPRTPSRQLLHAPETPASKPCS